MRLDDDSMTQKDRLETVLNLEIADRIPCYINGFPEYGDFYQELISREDELLDPYTEDDSKVLITPIGDFTVNCFFKAPFKYCESSSEIFV